MKYVVEARIYDNGTVAKMYEAETPPKKAFRELEKCDICVDVFDSKEEAVKRLEYWNTKQIKRRRRVKINQSTQEIIECVVTIIVSVITALCTVMLFKK